MGGGRDEWQAIDIRTENGQVDHMMSPALILGSQDHLYMCY